jgi:DNA-binding helix-hairpin-helix protein with protein kinase domain
VKYRYSAGGTLTLGKKLGEGGEGAVYQTLERPELVTKIYAKPPTRLHLAKLEAMITAADPTLRSVSAWPVGVVYGGAQPAGFTMPRLVAQYPLHDLLGPKRRQAIFPSAHWKFLVHTSINLARSFEVMHAHGIVIGDVNSNNVVVHGDSTTHLIDCDSFQIPAAGRTFRCGVGVAEYQPPELQGRDLSQIDRLPQHDLFGLAAMIFQVLFLGKHPFAGVLPARARAPNAIGDNIAARRYFYGPGALRAGLRPPPGSLTLTAVTPEMIAFFQEAFLGSPAARPSAATWRVALESLETRTVACAKNLHHRYVRGTACPWCALEHDGLYYFGGAAHPSIGDVDESVWQRFGEREIDRAWAHIAAVPALRPVEPAVPKTKQYVTRPLGLWTRPLIARYAAGGAIAFAAAVLLALAGLPVLAAFAAIAAAGTAVLCRPDARSILVERRRLRARAVHDYEAAMREWNRSARGARFLEEYNRLAKVRKTLKEQRARFQLEKANLFRSRERRDFAAYLEAHTIANAHLPAVDPRSCAVLLSFGIETAADVCDSNLRRIPGMPFRLKHYLLDWRGRVERSYRPPANRDGEKLLIDLKRRHARERIANRTELLAGPAALRAIAREIQSERPRLHGSARAAGERAWQAEADARVSPLLYRT